ncbi:hypothetical protein EX30DRAFT_394042 [Ascodesmis nigricans]|uniref:ORC6 first cyclin-like domain-containing protein n=1 Tax=Ascodesmis nigricans TaxID=341454 RepID=A0A4S2N137_9PEZI|nr:hypothetical protein EX30DRAFT_394042 [Ascodesmis nigricans]
MTSVAISTDLQSLLPTLVGPVPPELIHLATSLLAQSRSRISNLKPTEEVARSYACAHIACERLKNSLDLPPLKPRPPLPKKAYEGLLSHFRKSLPATTTRTRKKVEPVETDEIDAAFEDEMAAMCDELGVVPEAAQYIISGLKLTEHQQSERYSLALALTCIVFDNLSIPGVEEKVGGITWVRQATKDTVQVVLAKLNAINTALKGKGNAQVARNTLVKWVKSASEEPTWRLWVRSIPDGIGLVPFRPKKEVLWKRNRMLQDRVDYLSQERQEAYERWKEDVLRRCENIDGVTA